MVVVMDNVTRELLAVNNDEKRVTKANSECDNRIVEAYFFILLEYLNKKRKSEMKANDLMHSDRCIMISRSIQPYLMKRFHKYCRKLGIDYRAMGDVIAVDNAYSVGSILAVVNNYCNPTAAACTGNSVNAAIRYNCETALNHQHASPSILNPIVHTPADGLSHEHFICINPRHYMISLSTKCFSPSTNLSSLLMENNSLVRPPTLAPDEKRLNDLSAVDYNVLKAVESASEQLINKPNKSKLDSSKIEMDESIFCEWGTVMYYELNSRVGDAFASATPIVTIDGYTSPSIHSSRFSLGHLTNVARNSNIEKTRKFIGKGAKLYYIKGELFLECLSDNALFVQSPMSNIISGWHPATVIKIPPKCNIKVFNEKDFKRILHQHELRGFEAVFALTPLCCIRISFVKGWGASYS